jgi:hypothetical protein
MMLPLMLSLLLSAVSFSQSAEIPQSRPVAVLLKAVKDANTEQLKTAFSENMRRRFDTEGWEKVLKTYQDAFMKEFGDYKPEDFSYQFAGGENAGSVSIRYRGRTLPALRVIKEGNEWKVDER